MKKIIKFLIEFAVFLILPVSAKADEKVINIHLFYGNGCPHCAAEEEFLSDYLKDRPKEGVKYDSRDALFLSEQRKRISNRTVQYVVKEEMRIAGIDPNKYSVHKLRHTAATLMYKYGNVDIRALQVLLGHESVSTTEIYTHVDNEQIRSAIESNPLADEGSKD